MLLQKVANAGVLTDGPRRMGPGSSPGRQRRLWTHLRVLAARCARSFADRFALENSEGAGNAGCALHPRSHVHRAQESAHMSIQGSGEHPTSPAQWLYGLWRALPGERLFCLRSALGNRTSPRSIDASTATSGPHAFAVRVIRNRHAHFAPTASPPLVVTMANAPTEWDGMRKDVPVIWVSGKEKCCPSRHFVAGPWGGFS